VVGFALFNLVLEPVVEGSMMPTKELRAASISDKPPPDIHFSHPETIPINVVVVVRVY